MTEPDLFTGGCACGQLTFRAQGRPKRVGLCHCMTCRKISGGAFNAFVIFPVDQVAIAGELRTWSATPESERCFCPTCGSQVFDRDSGDEIEIKLGAFDQPNLFTPTYEAWTIRRERWLCTPDLLGFPGNRDKGS
jgi:hypothetical protein